MSRAEKVVLVVVMAAALAIAYAEATRRGHVRGLPGVKLDAHLGVDVGDDVERYWTCQPSDMRASRTFPSGVRLGAPAMTRRHHLYRRPKHSRPAHRELTANGWRAWIVDPPSEQNISGGS